MKSQTAYLEVVIPPDIINEETSSDMMVPEGGSAKLVCKARGFPKPKVVWKREDGREIIARNGSHGKTRSEYGNKIMFLWLALHTLRRNLSTFNEFCSN